MPCYAVLHHAVLLAHLRFQNIIDRYVPHWTLLTSNCKLNSQQTVRANQETPCNKLGATGQPTATTARGAQRVHCLSI